MCRHVYVQLSSLWCRHIQEQHHTSPCATHAPVVWKCLGATKVSECRHSQNCYKTFKTEQYTVQTGVAKNLKERSVTKVLDSEHEEQRWKKMKINFFGLKRRKPIYSNLNYLRWKTNLFVPKLSKEQRQTKVFVPQPSKEWRKTYAFIPQLSMEQRKKNLFLPKLSKERRKTQVFVPQLLKERRKTNAFVPQLSRERRKSKLFVPQQSIINDLTLLLLSFFFILVRFFYA